MDIYNYAIVTIVLPIVAEIAKSICNKLGMYFESFVNYIWKLFGYNIISMEYRKNNYYDIKNPEALTTATAITHYAISRNSRGKIDLSYDGSLPTSSTCTRSLYKNYGTNVRLEGTFRVDGFIVQGKTENILTGSNGHPMNVEIYTFSLTSRRSLDQMKDWLKARRDEHIDNTIPDKYVQTYFMQNIVKKTLRFNEQPITYLGSTFDDIFFPMKAELISMVDRVESGDIPALRIILYGPPGTGKTSVIRAIAHRTGRSIIAGKLGTIPCDIDLEMLFRSDRITKSDNRATFLKQKKRLIIFEDFDCMTPIVHKRDENNHGFVAEKTESELSKLLKELPKKDAAGPPNAKTDPTNDADDKKGVTFDGLLNILDGVVPLHGPIIVMTTNHLEKIDPAIYRPDRMDVRINMAEMTPEDLKQMTHKLLGESIDMPTQVTPSTVSALAKLANRCPKKFRAYLTDPKIIHEYPSLAVTAVPQRGSGQNATMEPIPLSKKYE